MIKGPRAIGSYVFVHLAVWRLFGARHTRVLELVFAYLRCRGPPGDNEKGQDATEIWSVGARNKTQGGSRCARSESGLRI